MLNLGHGLSIVHTYTHSHTHAYTHTHSSLLKTLSLTLTFFHGLNFPTETLIVTKTRIQRKFEICATLIAIKFAHEKFKTFYIY